MAYLCEKCECCYPTEVEARTCEDQPTWGQMDLTVGDVVTFDGFEFGWHDGLDHWVQFIEPRRNRGIGDARLLIYVVTAITERRHQAIYHLETMAMEKGRGGYTNSWHFTQFTKLPEEIAAPLRKEAEAAGIVGYPNIYNRSLG